MLSFRLLYNLVTLPYIFVNVSHPIMTKKFHVLYYFKSRTETVESVHDVTFSKIMRVAHFSEKIGIAILARPTVLIY